MPTPVEDRVPVAPLREAFLASGLTPSEVCRRLEWTYRGRNGCVTTDTSRLQRALGLRKESHTYNRVPNYRIGYDRAVRIAEAIGVDPVDVGL